MDLALAALAVLSALQPAAGAPPSSAPGEAETLIRRVIAFQERQHELKRQYAYRERTLTQNLHKDGTVRRAESETYLVTPAPGGEYRRLVQLNGRPLSPGQEAEQERKFREFLQEQLELSEKERRQRTRDKLEDRVERYRSRLEEALDVYRFESLGDDVLDGTPVRVFRFTPRPGYEGHSRPTKILARMEGVLWIDPGRDQLSRLEVRFRENLNFLGGLFGRVSKGTRAVAEATLVDDLWLLDRIEVSLDARFYFLKSYRQKITVDFHDYQKYTVRTEELVTPKQ